MSKDRTIREKYKEIIPCIQSGCDLNGTVPGVDGEPEACQFCHEFRFPLMDKFEELLKQPEKQEIERTPVNESYKQQGYGEKYSLIDVAHKLDEVIEAVNKLLKE